MLMITIYNNQKEIFRLAQEKSNYIQKGGRICLHFLSPIASRHALPVLTFKFLWSYNIYF